MDEDKKCAKCQVDLSGDNNCKCNPDSSCVGCCDCGDDCDCGCKAKAA